MYNSKIKSFKGFTMDIYELHKLQQFVLLFIKPVRSILRILNLKYFKLDI